MYRKCGIFFRVLAPKALGHPNTQKTSKEILSVVGGFLL